MTRAFRLAFALLTLTVGWGCASPGVRQSCLRVEASPDLNSYDGQPHVTVLYLYPLESALGFEQMTVRELLRGGEPASLTGARRHVTVAPGENRTLRESFPRSTTYVGIVADFYRAKGQRGRRKLLVPARCGFTRTPRIALLRSELSLR